MKSNKSAIFELNSTVALTTVELKFLYLKEAKRCHYEHVCWMISAGDKIIHQLMRDAR